MLLVDCLSQVSAPCLSLVPHLAHYFSLSQDGFTALTHAAIKGCFETIELVVQSRPREVIKQEATRTCSYSHCFTCCGPCFHFLQLSISIEVLLNRIWYLDNTTNKLSAFIRSRLYLPALMIGLVPDSENSAVQGRL
jgi:hypothetical protein